METDSNSDSEIAKNTTKTKPSGTPPAKPSENSSSTSSGDTSTENNTENNAPPAMPECEEGSEDCEAPAILECEEGDENCEMPEMPADMQGGPGGGPQGEMGMDSGYYSLWHPAAFLGMGAGSVILSLAIVYGCLSKFYREKPAKVFDKWSKIAIFCGASLILAAGLCVLCYFLPEWT